MRFKLLLSTLVCLSMSACTSWSHSQGSVSSSTTHTTIPAAQTENTSTSPTTINSAPPTSTRIKPTSGSSTTIAENNVEDFYVVFGRRYAVMKESTGFTESGIASWYGDPFHGQKTSNGETYDMYQMTAAHKHLPLPTFVEVTRTDNGRSIIVRVNDRGPFKDERVIDLSYAAAQKLDMLGVGTAPVSIRALDELNQEILSERQNAAPIFVQVGSYGNMDNALSSQDLLKSINIRNSRILKSSGVLQKTLFRLQVGPLSTGQEYDDLISRLKNIGIRETVIVRQ